MIDTASLEGKNIIITGAAGGLGRDMTVALAGAGAYLATMFSSGQGVAKDKDPKETVRWYSKATEQGFTSAKMKLVFVYSMGVSVPADYGKRAYW